MIFIVVISGYLAFSVAYNKAFKVKNKIINAIEECEGVEIGSIGSTTTTSTNQGDCAVAKINKYISEISYNGEKNWNGDKYLDGTGQKGCNSQYGYCISEDKIDNKCVDSHSETGGCKYIYHVVTSVSINLPVINVVAPNMEIFRVAGVTSAVTKR